MPQAPSDTDQAAPLSFPTMMVCDLVNPQSKINLPSLKLFLSGIWSQKHLLNLTSTGANYSAKAQIHPIHGPDDAPFSDTSTWGNNQASIQAPYLYVFCTMHPITPIFQASSTLLPTYFFPLFTHINFLSFPDHQIPSHSSVTT